MITAAVETSLASQQSDQKGRQAHFHCLRAKADLAMESFLLIENKWRVSWVHWIEGRTLFYALPRKEKGESYDTNRRSSRNCTEPANRWFVSCRTPKIGPLFWQRRYQCKQIKKDHINVFKNHLKAPLPTTKNQCPWVLVDDWRRNRDAAGENVITKAVIIAPMTKKIYESITSILYGDFVGHCACFLHHQCLASKTRWTGSNDPIIIVTLVLISGGICSFKNCYGATKLAKQLITYDCQYSDQVLRDGSE